MSRSSGFETDIMWLFILLLLVVISFFVSSAVQAHATSAGPCEKQLIELKAENARLKRDIEAIYKAENGG